LQELPVDLAGPVVPMHVKRQWDVLTLRVDTARGGCNQILMKYNEALTQFPAKLVAGAMGFRPAGIL
jgi:LemA protein